MFVQSRKLRTVCVKLEIVTGLPYPTKPTRSNVLQNGLNDLLESIGSNVVTGGMRTETESERVTP